MVNIPHCEKNLLLSILKLHLRSHIQFLPGHQITRVKAVSLVSLTEPKVLKKKIFSVELRCVHLTLMIRKGRELIYSKKYISLFHIKIIMDLKVNTNRVSDASILNFLLEMFIYSYYGSMFFSRSVTFASAFTS